MAEMNRCDERAVLLASELLAHEEVAGEVEAQVCRDPRERDEENSRGEYEPRRHPRGASARTLLPAGASPQRSARPRSTTPSAGRRSPSARRGCSGRRTRDRRAQRDSGRRGPPRARRQRRNRDEDERDRDERDREVHERDAPAEPAREPLAGDVVRLGRIEPAVRHQHDRRDEAPQRPCRERLALRGPASHYPSAARSDSTTYSWSSAESRAWNGSASVRDAISSATGQRPTR